MKKRTGTTLMVRIMALVLALTLFAGILGMLSMTGMAAEPDYFAHYVTARNGSYPEYVKYGDTVNLHFKYWEDTADFPGDLNKTVKVKSFYCSGGTWDSLGSTLELKKIEENGSICTIEATLSNIKYISRSKDNILDIRGVTISSSNDYHSIRTAFDPSFFDSSYSSSPNYEDETNPYTSDIIIENIYVKDADGNFLDRVTKDSAPFTVEVVFIDRGLREIDPEYFRDNNTEMSAYLTQSGGFIPSSGTRGTLTRAAGAYAEAPRFRATFRGMKYDGGANSLAFRVEYEVNGWYVGADVPVTVQQAKANDDDESKLAPLIPHIIVSQYSYGKDAIAAGEEFTLNVSIKNTSNEIPLENIVMTITPETVKSDTAGSTTGGLTITSASNTYYIEKLGVGGNLTHSVTLRAEPNAAVGSHKVEVKFSFQYVDEANKKRETGNDSEGIAIPVTQVDRFSVDPLTDFTETVFYGDEGYLVVSFINRGKSTTYNVSGIVNGENLASPGQSQHFGNLEAGNSGTLEFSVAALEPGQISGEIIIQYEDDNTNQKEIPVPFTIYVEEPYYPPYVPPSGGMNPGITEPQGPSAVSIVFCSVGGIAIAIPLMLYIIKRTKAKGSEDFDEVF